jgi:hypothetical protein
LRSNKPCRPTRQPLQALALRRWIGRLASLWPAARARHTVLIMLVVRFILRSEQLACASSDSHAMQIRQHGRSTDGCGRRWWESLNRAPFWRCPVRRGDRPLSSIPGPRVFRPLHLSPRPGGRTTPRRFPWVRQVNSAFHTGAERVWRANNLGLVRQVDRRRLPSREIRAAVTKALHGSQKTQSQTFG